MLTFLSIYNIIQSGMIKVTNLKHGFSGKTLYESVTFSVFNKEHIGVIGQNGTGKSTLIKIIAGELLANEGTVWRHPKAKFGHLDQYADIDRSLTVDQYLKGAFQSLYDAEKRLSEINEQLVTNQSENLIKQAATLNERLKNEGFYEVAATVGKVAAGLGITAIGMDTLVEHLSGGQRAKIILAKLLLEKPTVLLMDEPTNFLDVAHIEWLTKYLSHYPGAFLVVSHDFEFLNAVTDGILDIEFGTITKYSGNYRAFIAQKEMRREQYGKDYLSQQKIIEKLEDYIARNKARASTARMAQSRQKTLDKMDKIPPPNILKEPVFNFKYAPINSSTVLEVKDLSVGYYYPLLPKLSFEVKNKERVAVTGFNGIGKTTLIKSIVGAIKALGGSFKFAQGTLISYFAQDLFWEDEKETPLMYLKRLYPRITEGEIRKILATCAVKNEHALQAIPTLSGGEQSKVKLAALMLTPSNFLIFDEPTNHLDAEAKSALVKAIKKYEGTVMLVSHEKAFYEPWANKIIDLEQRIVKR